MESVANIKYYLEGQLNGLALYLERGLGKITFVRSDKTNFLKVELIRVTVMEKVKRSACLKFRHPQHPLSGPESSDKHKRHVPYVVQ